MIPAMFRNSRLLIALVAAVGIATVALATTVFNTDAASFNPVGDICLDDEATIDPAPFVPGSPGECDGNNAPGAATATTGGFSVTAQETNFGGIVNFTPLEWGISESSSLPDGTQLGALHSEAVLGLINGGCATVLPVAFDMLKATIDQSDTVMFNDPNDPNLNPQFEFVGGVPRGALEYPDYLLRSLVDSSGNALQPIGRLYGQTIVSGIDVSINFVLFEPGVNIDGTQFSPELGYPAVTVLQNGGDPDVSPEPGVITDFCSPLKTSVTLFGSANGADVRTNPADPGDYAFVTWALSQRDADGDGHENSLDTCPFTLTPNWDPRVIPNDVGDTDMDGIPDECDPLPENNSNPEGGAIADHDGDGYYNRQDNCPLVKNNLGLPLFGAGGPDNQGDDDGDGIGNACDPNPNDADAEGVQITVCIVNTIRIGAGSGTSVEEADAAAVAAVAVLPPCGTAVTQAGDTDGTGDTGSSGGTGGSGSSSSSGGSSSSGSAGGVGGGPDSGVGSLSPTSAGVPLWALALAVVSVAGLLAGATLLKGVRSSDE